MPRLLGDDFFAVHRAHCLPNRGRDGVLNHAHRAVGEGDVDSRRATAAGCFLPVSPPSVRRDPET